MSKLLNTNFYELFKSRFFYITTVICAFIGTAFTIGMYLYPKINVNGEAADYDKSNILFLTPNFAAITIPFAAATTVALLLDSQFNQGAVRNKLIAGHSRTEVYLSNLITACVPTVIYLLAFEIPAFALAALAFGYDGYQLKAAAVSLSVMLLMILSISTVLSFVIGNLLRGGKMFVVLLAVQYVFNGAVIFSQLSEKSKIFEILMRTFPQGYMFLFSYSEISENIHINAIISVVLIALLTIFGMLNFKKCDILLLTSCFLLICLVLC